MASKKKPSLSPKKGEQPITPADDAPMSLGDLLKTMHALGDIDFSKVPDAGLSRPDLPPSLQRAAIPGIGSAGMGAAVDPSAATGFLSSLGDQSPLGGKDLPRMFYQNLKPSGPAGPG